LGSNVASLPLAFALWYLVTASYGTLNHFLMVLRGHLHPEASASAGATEEKKKARVEQEPYLCKTRNQLFALNYNKTPNFVANLVASGSENLQFVQNPPTPLHFVSFSRSLSSIFRSTTFFKSLKQFFVRKHCRAFHKEIIPSWL